MSEKRTLVAAGPERPSLRKQCELIGLSWSSRYYESVVVDKATLQIMQRIDEMAMAYPFWGSRNV